MENVYMYGVIRDSPCLGVSVQYVLYYIAQVISACLPPRNMISSRPQPASR